MIRGEEKTSWQTQTDATDRGPSLPGPHRALARSSPRALARRGYHVVLVSRRPERLAEFAQSLSAEFGVQTRVVAADLSVPGAGKQVMDAVGDLDVGLLVSNAGAARLGGFLQNRVEDLSADLNLNALSHMELSHAFGSRLRAQGRSGGILLVSSTAALQPMALAANYSGAKSFVLNLGESIHRELAEIGVDVTVLLPGPTDTKGLREQGDVALGNLPMAAMSVERLVSEGLRALSQRKASHVAGAMNRWSARLMPRRLAAWIFSKLLRRNAAKHLLPTAPIAALPPPKVRGITSSAA